MKKNNVQWVEAAQAVDLNREHGQALVDDAQRTYYQATSDAGREQALRHLVAAVSAQDTTGDRVEADSSTPSGLSDKYVKYPQALGVAGDVGSPTR